MKKTTWKTRSLRFKDNMKSAIDGPVIYVVGAAHALGGYLETGTIKGAMKQSATGMGAFIVGNGVVGTIIEEINDKLED